MVSHLEVDEIRRHDLSPSPALLYDLEQLCCDVEAEPVIPTIFEPGRELIARVVVKDVEVEVALNRESTECQVAATEESVRRVDGIATEKQI